MKKLNMYIFAVILMSSIASTYGMNRFVQSVRSVADNVKTNVKTTVNNINTYPEQDCPRTFVPFPGKVSTQAMHDRMRAKAENSELPSTPEINEFMNSSKKNKYPILNQPNDVGNTLFYTVVNNKDSLERMKCIKNLSAHGAQLSNRDKYVMGPTLVLKTLLNVSRSASESTIVKVLRTFLTKNTDEQLWVKFLSGKMTADQVHARDKKKIAIVDAYNAANPGLYSKCVQQRAQQRADAKNKRRNME